MAEHEMKYPTRVRRDALRASLVILAWGVACSWFPAVAIAAGGEEPADGWVLRSACEGAGFSGTYGAGGARISFEACRLEGDGVRAVVRDEGGHETYRYEGNSGGQGLLRLGGRVVDLDAGAAAAKALRAFADSPEGRALMCLLVEAKRAGIAANSVQWMALSAAAPAFEGRTAGLPCAAEGPDGD